MDNSFQIKSWNSPSGRTVLESLLNRGGSNSYQKLRRHLQLLNVNCYVVEHQYSDPDNSADLEQIVSYKSPEDGPFCKRVHFFSGSFGLTPSDNASIEETRSIVASRAENYCGFATVPEDSSTPLGVTVLKAERGRFELHLSVTCVAEYKFELLGNRLSVVGTAFQEQDPRICSSSDVAMWTGMRHMHKCHDCDWMSVSEIAKLAGQSSSSEEQSQSGETEGNASSTILATLRHAGYHPVLIEPTSKPSDFVEQVDSYVESGVPVVLSLNQSDDTQHFVTVIGRVLAGHNTPYRHGNDYVAAFIVHDDQSGPYQWLPRDEEVFKEFNFSDVEYRIPFQGEEIEVNFESDVLYAIAMPRDEVDIQT